MFTKKELQEFKVLGETVQKLEEKNCPTNPSKWSYYKSQAKQKFDVYPSAYANGWASKQYGAAGGGWKKCADESVNEINLKSVGVKEFLKQLVKNQSLIKKLGFKNMKDVLAYIQGGGIDDWMELRQDGQQLGITIESVTEDHSLDPNDKYVVKPCDKPGEPWAVWEGPVRVKGFASRQDAELYADTQNREQGLAEGNAFTGALYQARKEGKKEFEFNGKTYPVQEAKDETLEEGIKMKKLHEGSFSEIDIMAREARNFNDFVKEFYKDYKDFPKDRETIKWLKSLYDGRSRDESVNEEFKSKDNTFEKVYGIFDKKDYFNAKGLAKTQIGNFERALQRNDKGAQEILDKFKGDVEKAKEYIIQVISDQKKAQAFEDYKALKGAIDSIQKGKPEQGAVNYVKRIIHNNNQKYSIALYSVLRGKKFNNYKDIHADVDSLIGESVNEGKKRFRQQNGIGKSKYTISYHDGKKKHKDGSDFFDIQIFKNQKDVDTFRKSLLSKGYVEESVNEEQINEWKLQLDLGKVNPSEFENWASDSLQKKHKIKVSGSGRNWTIVGKGNDDRMGSSADWISQLLGKAWKVNKIKVVQKESVNEAMDQKQLDSLRKHGAGYVGSQFAKVASDEDLELMVRLKNKNAEYYNLMQPNIKSMDHLYKKYKIKSSKGIEK